MTNVKLENNIDKNKKQNGASNNADSPFHVIVVTSPDARSAEAALKGPLKRDNLPTCINESTNLISTSDPFDTRLGSGGGTLAAIEEADSFLRLQSDCSNGSILIVHAGGQSSRCPTQMTLGKAWTDLPLLNETDISNPTYILIESLSCLLKNLPCGSIVVAASDVILDLPTDTPISFEYVSSDKVLGLAVPAPLSTAKNHGVFSISQACDTAENKKYAISDVEKFLQKPSIPVMTSCQGCTFIHNSQEMAWIDTGVVIFLPKAADALRELMVNDLSQYTKSGLQQRMDIQKGISVGSIVGSKLELYTHLLLAIPTKGMKDMQSEEIRLQRYLSNESNSDLCSKTLDKIFRKLSVLELQVCTLLDGSFIHLGTTKELMKFMIEGAMEHQTKGSGSLVKLATRRHTFMSGVYAEKCCVIMNSVIDSSYSQELPSFIGNGSIVEHCYIDNSTIQVGSSCVVSCLRGWWHDAVQIPSNTIFQMLPLTEKDETNFEYVFMYLGANDNVKEHAMCYGIPFEKFLDEIGIRYDELWSDDDTQRHLWNARIHPVISVPNSGFIDWKPLIWINNYLRKGQECLNDETVQSSLISWRRMRRLSLSEIQKTADASCEFLYRSTLRSIHVSRKLSCAVTSIRDVLLSREHKEVKLEFLVDLLTNWKNQQLPEIFSATMHMFLEVVASSIKDAAYDIASRTLMILSSLCLEVSDNFPTGRPLAAEYNEEFIPYLDSLKTINESPLKDCEMIVKLVEKAFQRALHISDPTLVTACSRYLEEAAFALTARCVISSIPQIDLDYTNFMPIGTWVVSSAPARVDLSGGWSDTPPVSYEFGGTVACLAVMLHDLKPLSARCRLRTDITGVKLTVENRDIETGDIKESDSVHITTVEDLSNFRDPEARCALLKCALIALGLVPIPSKQTVIDDRTQGLLCTLRKRQIGLELVSTSLLPHGSGLGTSSILAGCIVSSLGRCVGLENIKDQHELVNIVLNLEQLLSTGGGWQDQVGGIFGGLKLCSADVNVIPVHVHVQPCEVPHDALVEFNERLVLAFAGQPRLAKNILQKVVRRWAKRSPHIVQNVQNLVDGARQCIGAIQRNDFDEVGMLLNSYWKQKKIMAGKESGVEPTMVRKIFDILSSEGITYGSTLAGAGGGGFMAMLLRKGMTVEDAQRILDQCKEIDPGSVKWYSCKISNEGLTSFFSDDSIAFSLEWHTGHR